MAAPTPSTIQLEALRYSDPPAWRSKVINALKACGNLPDAAKRLGYSLATLRRRISADLSLAIEIDRAGVELRGPGERVSYNVAKKKSTTR